MLQSCQVPITIIGWIPLGPSPAGHKTTAAVSVSPLLLCRSMSSRHNTRCFRRFPSGGGTARKTFLISCRSVRFFREDVVHGGHDHGKNSPDEISCFPMLPNEDVSSRDRDVKSAVIEEAQLSSNKGEEPFHSWNFGLVSRQLVSRFIRFFSIIYHSRHGCFHFSNLSLGWREIHMAKS